MVIEPAPVCENPRNQEHTSSKTLVTLLSVFVERARQTPIAGSLYCSGSQSGRYRRPGAIGPSKVSINSHGVEWGSLNGQGVNE